MKQSRNLDVERLLTDSVTAVIADADFTTNSSLVSLGASSVHLTRLYDMVATELDFEFDISILFEAIPLSDLARRISDSMAAEQEARQLNR